ncbi:hypothetical protein KHA80_07735 [Anaerobacillus sp. HL2]|nr:hypothetical protein KHA80_07735 [Anaerobacillus sp. HL2]
MFVHHQSVDIAAGRCFLKQEMELLIRTVPSVGDQQGTVYGYATNETRELAALHAFLIES